jgi:hypothetical protein
MVDPEVVSNTLLALLQTATFESPIAGATTWQNNGPLQRRLRLFSDVAPADQPAMFLVCHDEEEFQQGRGIPARVTLMYSVVAYCRADPGTVGDTLVSWMLGAIRAALLPIGQDTQTLGGLVYKCWVRGKVFRDPGDLDDQAMLIVPVEVMLP